MKARIKDHHPQGDYVAAYSEALRYGAGYYREHHRLKPKFVELRISRNRPIRAWITPTDARRLALVLCEAATLVDLQVKDQKVLRQVTRLQKEFPRLQKQLDRLNRPQ